MTVSRLPNNDGGIQPTILTAKGDLLTATAASTINRLGVGTDGQVLTADSTQTTGMKWATPTSGQATAPSCVVYESPSNLTFTGGTPLTFSYTNEEVDTNNFHDNVTNNSRLTIPTSYDGIYVVTFSYLCSGSGSGYFYSEIQKNGASISGFVGASEPNGRGTTSTIIKLAAGDYLTSTLQIGSSGTFSTWRRFSLTRVGS